MRVISKRVRSRFVISSRRRSRERWWIRSVSSTFSSSSWNGSGSAGESTSRSVGPELDLAGREPRVDASPARAARARRRRGTTDSSARRVRGLGRLGRALRGRHDLDDAAAVAEVDEDRARRGRGGGRRTRQTTTRSPARSARELAAADGAVAIGHRGLPSRRLARLASVRGRSSIATSSRAPDPRSRSETTPRPHSSGPAGRDEPGADAVGLRELALRRATAEIGLAAHAEGPRGVERGVQARARRRLGDEQRTRRRPRRPPRGEPEVGEREDDPLDRRQRSRCRASAGRRAARRSRRSGRRPSSVSWAPSAGQRISQAVWV